MLPGSPVCKTFHSVFVLFRLPDSSIPRKQRELGELSFRNIWDIGKQIFNSGIKMKGNKTLFVCFSHKRIWCTTEYGFRASPIEESYAYEVIPNSSVWLTIQQLWNHSTGSVTIQKPWTHILAENGLLKTTWNYYSKIEGCSRLLVWGSPDPVSSGTHIWNLVYWTVNLLVCVILYHGRVRRKGGAFRNSFMGNQFGLGILFFPSWNWTGQIKNRTRTQLGL